MKQVQVIENKGNVSELKWLVVVDGKIVASHNVKETSEQHKEKILTPIRPAMYKGKIL